MNKLVLLFLFPFFLSAQGRYFELNAGVSRIDSYWDYGPGVSALIGKRFEFDESNFLVDMQIGLAFPSILTAKIGLGGYLDKEKKVAIIAGVRPWPLHAYTQVNLKEGEKGQWIISYEAGSALIDDFNVDTDLGLSLESLFIINFGYRWNIGKKK